MSDATLPPSLTGSKRKRWSIKMKLACAGVLILILLKAASWWFDVPFIADPFPTEIAQALKGSNARCYV